MNKEQEGIPINIWDDFEEYQETFIYVEDFDISFEDKLKHLETIKKYIIENVNTDNITFEIKSKEIHGYKMYVYGLSYDLYEKWIESLVGIKNIDGFNFIIYSES